MELDVFLGVLAAVGIGNGLSVAFFYAIFWGDAQKRRGFSEEGFPFWWFISASVPPLLVSFAAWYSLY